MIEENQQEVQKAMHEHWHEMKQESSEYATIQRNQLEVSHQHAAARLQTHQDVVNYNMEAFAYQVNALKNHVVSLLLIKIITLPFADYCRTWLLLT